MVETPNFLRRKLQRFTELSEDDKAQLDTIVNPILSAKSNTDLMREGEKPLSVLLVVEGFACRYKVTSGGDRQIIAYMIPGDLCDMNALILKAADHSIATLSPCRYVRIAPAKIDALLESPRLARALVRQSLVDSATMREWLVNIGQRSAEERVAHLLCELLLRLRAVGLATDDDSYQLPINQVDIADTMGITPVHVNRVLQSLRKRQLIIAESKTIAIPDMHALSTFSGFNPNYLHLENALQNNDVGPYTFA